MTDNAPVGQRALAPRSTSPELMSWDNPFPVFPGAKRKKDAQSQTQDVGRMMSEMSIRDKTQGARQPSENGPQTSGSKSSQGSSRIHRQRPEEMDHHRPVVHTQERPQEIIPPGQPSRPPYAGPEPVISQGQQVPTWQQGRQRRPIHLPELDTQQSNLKRSYNSRPAHFDNNSGQESQRNQYPYGSGSESRDQAGQWPQSAITQTERPMMAPRAHSDDARHVPNQTSSFNPSYSGQVQGDPRTNHQSVGDFLDSYYEPANGSHELPTNEEPPRQWQYGQVKEEDMPNFDAVPFTPSSGRRGMTIYDHMSVADGGYTAYVPPRDPDMPGSNTQSQEESSNVAAQAHRSRSHPDLRKQGRSPVFEMAGDIPSVPSVPVYRSFSGSRPPDQGYYADGNGQYDKYPPHTQAQLPGPLPESQAYAQFDFNTSTPPQPSSDYTYGHAHRRSSTGPTTGRASVESEPARLNPSTGRPFNPDALPEHPTPIRPGLVSKPVGGQQSKPPPPMRQYNNSAPPLMHPASNVPPTTVEVERRQSLPVTHGELASLQQAVKSNPGDRKLQLTLAKKWVEASVVLADNGGRADPKTRNKNREKYIMDAYKLVKKLVSNGYPEAMFYLADCYGTGRLGLENDPKEAFNLYQTAAKAGHAQSAYRTAVCWEMGQEGGGGTRKDPLKAIQWYKKAASFGDTPAMYKMGMILLKGLLGQPRNPREAIVWLRRAADRADEENPHALHELVRDI